MNLNTYNIYEDWGWYVDTENNIFINSKIDIIINKPNKKMESNVKLEKIDEEKDHYDYYKNNYRDIETLELDSSYKKLEVENEKKNKNSGKLFLYKIGSTTLITALLTYVVFFLI